MRDTDQKLVERLRAGPKHDAKWLTDHSDLHELLNEAADAITRLSSGTPEMKGLEAELAETTRILEACHAVAIKADPLDAPFPMDGQQATIWHQARVEAFRHALEMMPSLPTEASKP